MNILIKFIVFIVTILSSSSTYAQLEITGSSTAFPFITEITENFIKNTEYKTPIIKSTGSVLGIERLCSDKYKANKSIIITTSSRQIEENEKIKCLRNFNSDVTEIKIGYDGMVLAQHKLLPRYNLTKKEIFLALSEYILINGEFILNPYQKWSDINPNLPNEEILIYGPPASSATRELINKSILQKFCKRAIKKQTLLTNKNLSKCDHIRKDGRYIEGGENDYLITNKLKKTPSALGIEGFIYLEKNMKILQGASINGIIPSFDSISYGIYPFSRSLYIYIKNSDLHSIEARDFIKEATSKKAIGKYGYLSSIGLIPIDSKEFTLQNTYIQNILNNF